MTALAVMIALVGAMFVALGSASAQTTKTDAPTAPTVDQAPGAETVSFGWTDGESSVDYDVEYRAVGSSVWQSGTDDSDDTGDSAVRDNANPHIFKARLVTSQT